MSFKPENVRIPYQEYYRPDPPQSNTNPGHYSRWKIQPLQFAMANDLPFWMGNVIKYMMRYDQKNGLEDLHKARVYLDTKINELENKIAE